MSIISGIFIPIIIYFSAAGGSANYVSGAQWALLAANPMLDRHPVARCHQIPRNFSLCHGMQYGLMRLPNFLDHDSMDEAIQQSKPWASLLRLHCHQDARLFLCSLFAPICLPDYLENHIKPCKSLCNVVKQGCEERMVKYGFPWPQMLECDRFPDDNDMCIKPIAEAPKERESCKSCIQASTYENILDTHCQSTTVLKARLRRHNESHIAIVRRIRLFTPQGSSGAKGGNDKTNVALTPPTPELIKIEASQSERGCRCPIIDQVEKGQPKGAFLVTADQNAVATLILPWKQNDKTFKSAIRRFKKTNCKTLGREIRESVSRHNFRPISRN